MVLTTTIQRILASSTADMMELASLLGMLVYCQDLVIRARFHTRPLQRALRPFQSYIERQRHRDVPISLELKTTLRWWT